ncbi:MAG: integration host factor subunit alpha, partial [Thermodesulfobacteriota bacterium]|nr:integration host factor subunit alpha [Thermodesulfobacteriota bacterium]
SKQATSKVVDDLFEIIKENLEKGESVTISGFGAFQVREKKSRQGRNPRTGEEITISARRVVSFKPSQLLRKALNKTP